MKNVLLLIPTQTYRAQDFIRGAQALGVNLIVASQKQQAMHRQMKQRTMVVNMDSPEIGASQIIEAAKQTSIDAIVSVDDKGLKTAALACQELGLRHISLESAGFVQDKISMRQKLRTVEITQPLMTTYLPGENLSEKVSEIGGFPVVSKPATLSGSIGVIRANSHLELAAAVESTLAIQINHGCSPQSPIIIEQYLPGAEYAVDAIISNDSLKLLAFFEKPTPLVGPFFAESIYITPAQLDHRTQHTALEMIDRARRGLEIKTGPIHAEIRIDDLGRIYLIEIAGRSIGGRCSRAIPFKGDVNLEELILAEALEIELPHYSLENQASGVFMMPVPKAGNLKSIAGLDAARKVPWIVSIDIAATIGADVLPIPYDCQYLGFIFAKAPSAKVAQNALEQAHKLIELEIS